jgi:3-hydroxyisobutyrate dehydrogenase
LGESDAVGFSASGVVKDGIMFRRVAAELGVAIPAIEAAFMSFRAHQEAGHGEADLATMVRAAYEGA